VNKSELITTIAETAAIPKTIAEKTLKATLEGIAKALANDESVTFIGFGSFSVLVDGLADFGALALIFNS
jgi:DNA-binding protein HU-beta